MINAQQQRRDQDRKNRSDAMNRALHVSREELEQALGDLFFTRMVLVGVTLVCALLATNFAGQC